MDSRYEKDDEDDYVCDYCEKFFDENHFDYHLHEKLAVYHDSSETFCCEECAKAFFKEEAEAEEGLYGVRDDPDNLGERDCFYGHY